MSNDEDTTLLEAAKGGDRRAREHLVENHLHDIRSVAFHYRGLGLPFDDLVQEGSLGLLEAIDLYDPERGADFEIGCAVFARAVRSATARTEKSRLDSIAEAGRRELACHRTRGSATRGGRGPSPDHPRSGCGTRPTGLCCAQDLRPLRHSCLARPEPASPTAPHWRRSSPTALLSTPRLEGRRATSRQSSSTRPSPPCRSGGAEVLSRHFGLGRTPQEIADVAAALHLSQQRTRAIERDALFALRNRLDAPPQSSPLSLRRRWKR